MKKNKTASKEQARVPKKQLLWQLPFLLLLVIGTVWIVRQHRNRPYQRIEGMVFGTNPTTTCGRPSTAN